MPADSDDPTTLNRSEQDSVERCCDLLGLGPTHQPTKLSAGQSGSLVVALTLDQRPVVLKITTDAGRRARAALELRLISQPPPGLAEVVPRFVAGMRDDDRVCLVTERYEPLPRPHELSDTEWSDLATALGAVHSAPCPPWELPPPATPSADTVSGAIETWAGLGAGADAERAAAILGDQVEPAALESVLVHGDCHVENLVRDETGRFRWIDWQEAHRGNGLGDLVFLWQRAEFDGARPPREAMITAYALARGLQPDPAFRDALEVVELRLLLISWAPFLGYGTAERRSAMRERMRRLVESLGGRR